MPLMLRKLVVKNANRTRGGEHLIFLILIYFALGFVGFIFAFGKVWFSAIDFKDLVIIYSCVTMILSYIATFFYPEKWWIWGFLLTWQAFFFAFICLPSAFGSDGPQPFYHWFGLSFLSLFGGFLGSGIALRTKNKFGKY